MHKIDSISSTADTELLIKEEVVVDTVKIQPKSLIPLRRNPTQFSNSLKHPCLILVLNYLLFSVSVNYSFAFEIPLQYKVMLYITSNKNLICQIKEHLRTAGEKSQRHKIYEVKCKLR